MEDKGEGNAFDVDNYVSYDCIITDPKFNEACRNDIHKYSKGKNIVSLGCANGEFE